MSAAMAIDVSLCPTLKNSYSLSDVMPFFRREEDENVFLSSVVVLS